MALTSANQPPRVSVIVPAYNAATTIAGALTSVFAQSYRDFEVIVVDDGSADGTETAIEPWQDAVTYVRQPNGGPGRARNVGVANARGSLIAFLDADDVWLPEKLACQVAYFDAFPSTGLLHTAAVVADFPQAVSLLSTVPASAGPLSPPRNQYCEIFETAVEVSTLTVMTPRAVFRDAGGFDERREVHVEDWDLWLRIAAKHPVGYLRRPLAVHHRGGVMSNAIDKTYAAQLLVIERATAVYREQCKAIGRDAEAGLRRTLHRAAWEHGYRLLARNDLVAARRAFRHALRYKPTDISTHVYHLGSHLPSGAIDAFRRVNRRWLRLGRRLGRSPRSGRTASAQTPAVEPLLPSIERKTS